ncbi:MAG: hypothetical protein QXP02_03200 [Desulfurococcaceae archaeon]
MDKLYIKSVDMCIEISSEMTNELTSALRSTFTRRYVPSFKIADNCQSKQAEILWIRGSGFRMISAEFQGPGGIDFYVIEGDPPMAYVNESPVFFMVQVFARSFAKAGYIVLTDSVSISIDGEAVLLLGYPHTGKSTISAIAYGHGYPVLSTENTIVKPSDKGLEIVGGTRVLVFDPRIKQLFDVKIEGVEKTKHGYEIIDLDIIDGELVDPIKVSKIYVLHTSFSSHGVSLEPVKGRKIVKTLWYFATSLLKGIDYYEPMPVDMPITRDVKTSLEAFMNSAIRNYENGFFEVFGSPLEVFKKLIATH